MIDEQYLKLAIKLAKSSTEKIPVGVLIVQGGEIIAQAVNSHHLDNDATAHAEIKAIREAGNKLGNKNLHGCAVYTTCEPCTMCASALFYAEVDKIVYGVTMADIDPNNTRIKITVEQLATKKSSHPVIKGGVLRTKCLKELYDSSRTRSARR